MSLKPIVIRHENGQRNVYKKGEFIAAIFDHRGRNTSDRQSTIRDNWGVAWCSGRYDWHARLSEALDNVRKA
jgi:hypothetical protein